MSHKKASESGHPGWQADDKSVTPTPTTKQTGNASGVVYNPQAVKEGKKKHLASRAGGSVGIVRHPGADENHSQNTSVAFTGGDVPNGETQE